MKSRKPPTHHHTECYADSSEGSLGGTCNVPVEQTTLVASLLPGPVQDIGYHL